MALPLRNDLSTASGSSSISASSAIGSRSEAAERHGFEPGGQIGRMHADLAALLTGCIADTAVVPTPKERIVRLVSIAGGYLALVGAYAGVVFVLLH